MRIKVWLDDIREAPEGWVWVDSVKDVIALLSIRVIDFGDKTSLVEEISLDNDLGLGEEEGHMVMNWLEREVATNPSFQPPKINIHTMNLVAEQAMEQVRVRIEKLLMRRKMGEI